MRNPAIILNDENLQTCVKCLLGGYLRGETYQNVLVQLLTYFDRIRCSGASLIIITGRKEYNMDCRLNLCLLLAVVSILATGQTAA